MRNHYFALCAAFTIVSSISIDTSAQDVGQAYDLSNTTVQGSARSMGFGGALGSVGGDFSSLSVNPAGLGIYTTSQISFSPSFKATLSQSDYLGELSNKGHVRFNLNQFGVVYTDAPKGKRYDRRKWKTVALGLGVNRVADYNRNYYYTGRNTTSSASQAFESNANMDSNNHIDPYTLAYTGYQAYLINPVSRNTFSTVVPFKSGIRQTMNSRERGGLNELVIALGGNYKEKIMIGGTIGVPILNYQKTTDYTESIIPGSGAANPANFKSFTYSNNRTTTGAGINMKLGIIVPITRFFRIGAAFHTPTVFGLHDVLDYGVSSDIGGGRYNISTANDLPQKVFDYSFTSPSKAVLSAAFVFRKIGFITADYEYINYSSMRFRYPGANNQRQGILYPQESDRSINDVLRNSYTSAHNLRLGAEILLSKYLMVRGGIGYYGNPYSGSTSSVERVDLSTGIGFRNKHFFADMAIMSSAFQVQEEPYSNIDYRYVNSGAAVTLPVAITSYLKNNIGFTVGFKF